MIRLTSVVIFLLYLFPGEAFSQCCSPGNPIGGTSNAGTLKKGNLRSITFYKYGYSDTYYEENRPSDYRLLSRANYNYLGQIFAFGVTDKITSETELGYFLDKTQDYDLTPAYQLSGYGLSNLVVSLKYNFMKSTFSDFEFTGGIGAKLPLRIQPQYVDNVRLPEDIQPSTRAYGMVAQFFVYKSIIEKGLHLFALGRFEANGKNSSSYKYGEAYYLSVFISKTFDEYFRWSGILQVRSETRTKDSRYGAKIPASGGSRLIVVPQLNYAITPKLNLSVMADLPVYQYYNNIQMASKYALTFNIIKDFSFGQSPGKVTVF